MYSEEVRFCYFVFSFSSDLQSDLQWLIMMKTRLTETFVHSLPWPKKEAEVLALLCWFWSLPGLFICSFAFGISLI